jgi:limonene-1,2-epoxide hydrolase
MDWQRWAETFENIDGADEFEALFASGGVFCDPVTPWTTDVRKVANDTDQIFPDWKQKVDRIRGGDDWAVFEWTGTATFPVDGSAGVPIAMEGATIISVDGEGKVTSWRDYLDTNQPISQIQAGMNPDTEAAT